MQTAGKPRLLLVTVATLALAACQSEQFDWDLRPDAMGSTADAALATRDRPAADNRGVIAYPGYQVAVARRGDTVASVAGRLGLNASELASANALQPQDPLREGEILTLPRRVSDPLPGTAGSGIPSAGGITSGPIDVTTIAGAAIDRASPGASAPVTAAPAGPEPNRHRVQRGETAYSIARAYGVSARALADWNSLGPDMSLREGQTLLIPTPTGERPAAATNTQPGEGTPTPVPPSAAKPLPAEQTGAANAPAPGTPASPNMAAQRTSGAAMAMPVQGPIIRSFAKGRNEGIDISANAGTAVKAAADGTVAAITKDTNGVPILVIRHADNVLTVYAGIDAVSVAKGSAVKRGQNVATIRQANPSFLHFEVRKGVDAVDPMGYLQ